MSCGSQGRRMAVTARRPPALLLLAGAVAAGVWLIPRGWAVGRPPGQVPLTRNLEPAAGRGLHRRAAPGRGGGEAVGRRKESRGTAWVTAAADGGVPAGERSSSAPAVPDLDDRVLFIGSAASVSEAVALIGDKLHVPVALAEPANLPPDHDKRLGPPGARRRPFRFERVPLRDVLDGVSRAMGSRWRLIRGIYVFWVEREGLRGTMARIARVVRERIEVPTQAELEQAIRDVEAHAEGKESVPVGDLSPKTRQVLDRMLTRHLLDEAERTAASLERGPRRLAEAGRLTFEAFAAQGRVTVRRSGRDRMMV